MKRKEIVFNALRDLSKKITYDDILKNYVGISTKEISDKTGIIRNNVSKELNELVAENRRPVYYFERGLLENLLKIKILDGKNSADSLASFLKDNKTDMPMNEEQEKDIFSDFIGSDLSLDVPIKQAKAAIYYPPRGLHTLIVGPTGSGKTTFAEMMYQYAINARAIEKDANFITFNCAEYADNPQLILSQLFGHVKGSFTGAERDNPGMIERAKGGILLLDEVHRLSPECQEMLFMLIDKNRYRRVGETQNNRKADILIVAATTEDVDSVLLKTFLRRIPMVITLPSLFERSLPERFELIKNFFSLQSEIIGEPIRVYKEVMKALLLYDCQGNIGQLKGDIQLICARGLLDYKTKNKKEIEIDTPSMPEHVYKGLLNSKKGRHEIFDLLEREGRKFYEFPQTHKRLINNEYNNLDNVYTELIEKYESCTKRGYSQEKINNNMNLVFEKYLQELLKKLDSPKKVPEKEKLFKIMSPRVYTAVEESCQLASSLLERNISEKVVVALAMHINALPERINKGCIHRHGKLAEIAFDNPKEYEAANLIRKKLEYFLDMKIPDEEVAFIAMFLYAVDSEGSNPNVGVIVLTHGNTTASSIADVCNTLLGTDHCKAINMSLDDQIQDILEQATQIVRDINQGKGVLLLVDMGSLIALGKMIEEETGIKTVTIDMVSTPLALDAVRKSLMPEMTLLQLYEDLQNVPPKMNSAIIQGGPTSKMIVVTCMTSEGTAVKLASLINESIPSVKKYQIIIRPMKISKIKKLDKKELADILVFVGTLNPKIEGIPYISTDEILIHNGLERISWMIDGRKMEGNSIPSLTFKAIEDSLSFLNPRKSYELLAQALDDIVEDLDIEKTQHLKVSFMMHNSCMIERVIRKEVLPYQNISSLIHSKKDIYQTIKKSFQNIEDIFSVQIPDTEIGYIIDMIDTD